MVCSLLNNKQLVLALSSIGDGVVVTDLLSRIVYVNHHAEDILGQSAEQVIGRDFDEVCNIVHYETRQPMSSPLSEVIRTNTTKGFENSATIARNQELIFVSATCSPFVNADKNIIGTITILRDVTRFKKFEMHYYNEEKNLRSVINSTPVGMVLLDNHFKIRDINTMALEMGGISKEEAIGNLFGDAYYCENNISQCGRGDSCQGCDINFAIRRSYEFNIPAVNFECKKTFIVGKGKKVLWLKVGATPVTINGQRNIIVTMVDITENKEKELTVTKARDFYFSMFEGVPAIVWRSGLQQEWLYLNDYWSTFTGRNIVEGTLHHWLEFVHPDDRKRYFEDSMQSLQKTKTHQAEIRLLHKSGEYRWLHCVNRPFYDMEGNLTGYIGMGFDIHDRKMAEQAFTRYKALLEKARDIILFIGLNGQIIDANDAALQAYGYTREELLACTIWDIRLPGDSPTTQMLTAYLEGVYFETVHRRKDGSVFPVEVSSKGTLIDDQEVVLSIIRDSTERKLTEQELKAAKEAAEAGSRAKGEFLANVSHEIRTPINGIVGMIDLTLMTELDEQQRENLITAKTCANSLVEIINDILDFSKIEAGKLQIDNIGFSPKELVEEIIKSHLPKATEKKLKLQSVHTENLAPVVKGDPNRLRQVLNNLISNAVKFTEKGVVTVVTKQSLKENNEVELIISVTDTGDGISPQNISRLFKPFTQIDGSITRKFGGTGLGLAISKQLVEMMNGFIWVESELGKGSTFFFTIRCELGDTLENKQLPTPSSYKTLFPKNILVAEDNKVNQDVIMRLLKEIGHIGIAVNNGLEVCEFLQRNPQQVDLILMDIQMPQMDGLESTRHIRSREDSTGGHIPIVALTAHALQGDKERFLALGMDGYLAKPVSVYELAQTIEDVWHKELGKTGLGSFRISECGEICAVNEIPQSSKIEKVVLTRLIYLVEQLQIVLEAVDIEKIEENAHKLKEKFNLAGIDKLKDLAFKVELAARRNNIQQIADAGKKLLEDFAAVLQTYKYDEEE
ncbi:MAG: arcB1 [Firmicutes bacterium]|nr:arcB1 [Bacillota bacterium]